MGLHRIKRGVDLRIAGAPVQEIHDVPSARHVGIVADDYAGLRARIAVTEGARVARGELLFEDRASGVRYTAPGAGKVVSIRRGPNRRLESIAIELSAAERAGRPSSDELVAFSSFQNRRPQALGVAAIRDLLLESGLWTAFRTRPFGRVPTPDAEPDAVFVNAMDTQPLAAAPSEVIGGAQEDFCLGIALLAKLSVGSTYLCVAQGDAPIDGIDSAVSVERFSGPHPAGTAGLHVHRLHPVGRGRKVWTIGYQDVVAVGELARTGQLPVGRVISIGGPSAQRPRLLRTRLGTSIPEITATEVRSRARLISGSVLHGRLVGEGSASFLGRYHLQISALRETTDAAPVGESLLSRILARLGCRRQPTEGSAAAGPIIPFGRYERVWPFDILPTPLLRALVAGDLEQAERLGCLELDEEDVALCSFVCPGRNDFGLHLRDALCRAHDEDQSY